MQPRKRSIAPSRGVYADDPPLTRLPSRSQMRDAEARAQLTPLAPGERPRAVTAAVTVLVALALANIGAYAAGTKIGGHRPAATQIAVFSGVMGLLAAGMWRNRYWAVLIMQGLLVITMLVFAILLTVARNLQAALECVVVVALAGTLFWFLVRAMARIQLTERLARESAHE